MRYDGHGGGSGGDASNAPAVPLDIDPVQVRAFSDELMDMLEQRWRPELQRILSQFGSDDRHAARGEGDRALGNAGGDYAGPEVGDWHSENVAQAETWVEQLDNGLTALSLFTAVMAEEYEAGDGEMAHDIVQAAKGADDE